jgi:hypothetical protein
VTNDDAINISEVIENMNMTISVTTAAIYKRSHINSPAQSDPTVITTFINTLISATLARGTSKTTPETATPSPVVIVVYMLADTTNCALNLEFNNVTNKSNFPIVMSVDFVITNDAFPDDENNITVRITVTVTITKNVATDVHAVLTAAR